MNVLSAIISDKDVLRYVADKAFEGLPRSRGQLSKGALGSLQSIVETFLLERESVLSFPPLSPLFIVSSVCSLSLLFLSLSLSPLSSLSLPLARTLLSLNMLRHDS